MAFYPFTGNNPTTHPLGAVLRAGIDNFRDGVARLQRIKGVMAQMTDAQVATAFGFADSTAAAAAKGELNSDVPSLSAAEQQMLDQFG